MIFHLYIFLIVIEEDAATTNTSLHVTMLVFSLCLLLYLSLVFYLLIKTVSRHQYLEYLNQKTKFWTNFIVLSFMLLVNTCVILLSIVNSIERQGFTKAFIKFLINLVPTTVLLFTLQVGDYIQLFNRHTSAYSIFQTTQTKPTPIQVENQLSDSQLYDLYGAESFGEGEGSWLLLSRNQLKDTGSFAKRSQHNSSI